MESGSRAEFRRSVGREDNLDQLLELQSAEDDLVIDADIDEIDAEPIETVVPEPSETRCEPVRA